MPLGNGQFEVEVQPVATERVAVEVCSELTRWQSLGEVPVVGGHIQFTDPEYDQSHQRFYRVRLVP